MTLRGLLEAGSVEPLGLLDASDSGGDVGVTTGGFLRYVRFVRSFRLRGSLIHWYKETEAQKEKRLFLFFVCQVVCTNSLASQRSLVG